MSNPEKIKNQCLVPVKSVSDTALYSNNHKSNEDENHLILMLREELKSTKDQYNSLKNSMSQPTNNEIEGLKLELEKLREEKISQNSSCQTVNGTIPSVLQAPQQQEINSATTVRSTVTPTTIMSSQHQGTRTGTHNQFIQQGSAATITSSHSQLCSSMQTGLNRQPYQSESSYQSEPLSLAPNYRNAKQQQNLGYSAPFSIQNGLASHQLTRQREDNSDIRQQEYGRRTRVPCYNGKEPWSAYQMQFELIAELNNWTPSVKAVELLTALKDDAMVYASFLSIDVKSSYSSLCAAMASRFGDNGYPETYRQELFTLKKQHRETIQEYASRVEMMVRK